MNNHRSELTDPVRREYRTKVGMTLVFLAGIGLIAMISIQTHAVDSMKSWGVFDLVLLGLATFRLGRLVAYDRVMEPFRQPFARTVPDETGAGESVEARGEGFRQAVGQLITCPICAGTWIAAGLVFALLWLPDFTRVILWATAAVALAEVINALVEAWCWGGQLSRSRVGEIMRSYPPKNEKSN